MPFLSSGALARLHRAGRPARSESRAPAIITVAGSIPPEQWNRLGTRLIPKMRAAGSVTAMIRLESEIDPARVGALWVELQQIIDEIGLSSSVRIERRSLGDDPAED